jgi:5'-3' exoribonuclease 2
MCQKAGHTADSCTTSRGKNAVVRLSQSVAFNFVKISVLREYLYLEFKDMNLPFPFDFERIVDDFVFMCFFVGNDFLPHLPSLHIREGAIDVLMVIYKNVLPSLGDYLTY